MITVGAQTDISSSELLHMTVGLSEVRQLDVSVVVLTFNRPERLLYGLNQLSPLVAAGAELIVVDNCSDVPAKVVVDSSDVEARVIRTPSNIGAAARNYGLQAASRKVIVTLDDDVHGLSIDDCSCLLRFFSENSTAGAVCFQVRDEITGEQINWCHHRKVELWGQTPFLTEEISEGAVAFRQSALVNIKNLYPYNLFISHEGLAAALRLMNHGFLVWYNPEITVQHATEENARVNWRRYYYDTRNTFLVVAQFLPLHYGIRMIARSVPAMFVYSVRDGFFRYWFRGLLDGTRGSFSALKQRERPSPLAVTTIKDIGSHRPSFLYMARKRLVGRHVRI